MKFTLIPVVLFLFFENFSTEEYQTPESRDTSPEEFPFIVGLYASGGCSGILITDNFVITAASCVSGATSASVYLGYQRFHIFHYPEESTQIIFTTSIIIHEEFKENNKHYLNNIALVKLSTPARPSNKIQLAKLISRQEAQMLEGKFVNLTGWFWGKDTNMKTATVELTNPDTCRNLFGSEILSSEEFCMKWPTQTRLDNVGNAVTVGNKVIGFLSKRYECVSANSMCGVHDTIVNLSPYIQWLADKMNKPIESFTNIVPVDSNVTQRKIDDLSDAINELTKEKNSCGKLGKEIEKLYRKLENDVVEIRVINNEVKNMVSSGKEEIGDLKIQVNNSRVELEDHVQRQFKELRRELNKQIDNITELLRQQKTVPEKQMNQDAAQMNSLSSQVKNLTDSVNKLNKYVF